jgi:hypothetical protein
MSQAVVQRWEAFLAQVKERFLAIMHEAREGCPQLFEQVGYDPVPMGTAWGAIDRRASDLESKIEDTWDKQVDAAFENAGAPPLVIEQERMKGEALRDFIGLERDRNRIAIHADAGRVLFQRAISELERPFACTQCGAPLEVPFTFRALNLRCPYCSAVNGFEPGMRMRYGEILIHPLCEEAAWNEYVAMRQADSAVRRTRSDEMTIDLLKRQEHAQIAFWRAYLGARARYLPDTAQAFEADLRGRMRAFYESMEREGAWIRAGRPRDLV